MPDRGIVDGHEGIGDQHLHAEHLGEAGEIAADAAIADDAKPAAGKLPPHHDLGHPARVVVRGGAGHAARQIDHVSDGEFGDRLDEAGACLRHQHAGSGRGRDIDVPDIDRATHEGAQVRQLRKYLARPRRHAVGDDDLDIARGLDQGGGIERIVALMQLDVGHGAQAAQAALAVIVAPHLRRMGQQDFHSGTICGRRDG